MKKFLAVILCFVYVVASSGATVNFHYCMGKFTGWNVALLSNAKCDNCSMGKEKKQGCCNDKHATFELKKDQLASTINDVPDNHFVYIAQQYPELKKAYINFCKDDIASSHSPPLIQPVSSLVLNCVFRV